MHEAHNDEGTPLTISVSKPLIKHHRKKRHKHDYQQWLCDPFNPVRGETSLWVAVITQAVMDALSRSRSQEALYHKHEAIRWLTGNSKDFIQVCLFANMDPDYVRQRSKRNIAAPTSWRAGPGEGKRYEERKAYRRRLREEKRKQRQGEQGHAQETGMLAIIPDTIVCGTWPTMQPAAHVVQHL